MGRPATRERPQEEPLDLRGATQQAGGGPPPGRRTGIKVLILADKGQSFGSQASVQP